jgi:hypothetical protein
LLVSTVVAAEPQAEFEITGGLGLTATMTNTGYEPLYGQPWLETHVNFLNKSAIMSPGMKEPLQPGESMTWRWNRPWVPLSLLTRIGLPPFFKGTVTTWIVENGGDHTIYGEKSVDATFIICYFIVSE